MSLGNAADRRIARHLRDQVDVERVESSLQAHARRGHGGLASGMAGADHDYVELFGELHSKSGGRTPENPCNCFFFHSSNLAAVVISITCRSLRSRPYIGQSYPSDTGGIMNTAEFFEQLDARIAKYDLLCHPFYKAWSAGELTRNDLREYAQDYYHHVEAFPSYLAAFGMRLEEGELRRAVLANMCDEKGVDGRAERDSVPHSELWLDFAEGMGSSRNLEWHTPVPEIRQLIRHFHQVASEGYARGSAGRFLRLRVAGAARRAGKRAWPARDVRRRRQDLRLLLAACDRRCLPLARLAQATGKANRSQSRDRRRGAGCGRERGPHAVAGAGRDRSAARTAVAAA